MARLQILELPEGSGADRPPFLLVIDQVADDEAERIIASQESFNGVAAKSGARAIAVFHGMTVDLPANAPPPVADDPERAGTTEIVYAHERTRLDLCSALLVSGDTPWRKLVELVAERQRELADLYRKLDAVKARPEDVRVYLGDMEVRSVSSTDTADRDEELAEARMWARHGYEIGQRHCGWSDHGVAPAWLTEGWTRSFDSCEHLQQAAAFDEALTRVRNLSTEPEVMDAQQERADVWKHGYHCGVLAAKSATRPRDEKASRP